LTLDSDVAWLARTRPFNLLPREAVQLVAFSCGKRRFKSGEILFRADEAGDVGYFLHSGAVLLSKRGAGPGSEKRVTAGALIGESALYAPITRRVDARVAEDAVVTPVSRETFRRMLAEFPAAAEKVRAALAERAHSLVEGLDTARVRSLDAVGQKPGVAP
jgi:CRP-like cAMP-binding protein